MSDSPLIDSLTAAVEDRPDDLTLRLHLAELLVGAGRGAEAIGHAAQVLAREPGNETAQRLMTSALGGSPEEKDEPPKGDNTVDWAAMEQDLGDIVPPRFAKADDEPDPVQGYADRTFDVERSTITLADVGGMQEVKKRLEVSFLGPLRNPRLRTLFGKSLRGGLLLYGPPGCGKTFLARAVAGELGASFFALGLSDVLDMWLGESERKLHDAFQAARRAAPCVLFLDELDALGQKRSHLRHSGGRNVVNQLLAELDGAVADNEGVFVLAATNHPWDVDTALRRPGRLDRTVLVLPPDEPARRTILEGALVERPVEGADVARLARQTDGFSGADLVHVVEVASEHALSAAVASGQMRPITQRELELARKETSPSTRAWFSTAYNYALYANEGGQYDELLAYIRDRKLL